MTLSADTQAALSKLLGEPPGAKRTVVNTLDTQAVADALVRTINNRNIKGLPEPSIDPEAMLKTVKELKEGYETLLRSRGETADSAILVGDMVAILEALVPFIYSEMERIYGLTPV